MKNNDPKKFCGDNDDIDDLHIPHVSFLQWHVGNYNAESFYNAKLDNELRPFAVQFFLEDLRAKTSYTHVKLEDEISQHIKVDVNDIDFWFEKNDEGYLISILVGLTAKTHLDAFKNSFDLVNSILSMLCFFYRRPFKVWQIHITDKNHNITYSTRPSCPKAVKLVLPAASFQCNPLGSLFAIYREGMNSIDLAYRYISFFKIYEAWFPDENYKKYFHKNNEEKSKIIITKNLLGGAYREKYHSDYIDKVINDNQVYSPLRQIRNYLAHPFLDRAVQPSYYNFDDANILEGLEALSSLIERIVTKIFKAELISMSKIDADLNKLLQIYNLN